MFSLKSSIILSVLLVCACAAMSQDYNNIEFIENKGQWDSRVKYKGEVNAGAVFIRSNGFTVLQHNAEDYKNVVSMVHSHDANAEAKLKRADGALVVRSQAWNVDFVGASPKMQVIPDKPISSYNNYFMGNDPSKWAGNCRIFQAMTLSEVYPNVDVRYYTDNGRLKYDIIAKPGADISRIALKYEGADKISVKNQELVLTTSVGEFRESSPFTYQMTGKDRSEVSCKYVIKDNIVRFNIKNYDRNSTLIIDPTLIFCSLSNSTATNWGFTATYGPDGAFYGGGIVFDNNSFPVTPGAFQSVYQGGSDAGSELAIDIGIIKLSSNGGSRIYATYLGGAGNEQPHSLVVDAQGNLIVAGRSSSNFGGVDSQYPLRGGPKVGVGGGYDIVVTKFNGTGTDLIGSRMIGGKGPDGVNIKSLRTGAASLQQNYGDDGRSEVIVDGGGNIYVASCTQSNNTSDSFPTNNAVQSVYGGEQDGVVLKFDQNLASPLPLFCTYLGGSGHDAAYVLALAPNGDIFVAGGTERGPATNSATDFPGNHSGTVGATHTGGDNDIDGFVAQLTNNGSAIIRSTYIGTAAIDQIFGIQFDRSGFPYVMGQTRGDFTPLNAAYQEAGGKQFIAKLRPDLSAYVYKTRFGTNTARPNISPTAFLVDRCENVYVSGWGGPISEPGDPYPNAGTFGLGVTPDALQPSTDGRDFYFFVLARDAASRLYASFFGQNGGFTDHVDGGTSRFDQNGVIYQGVCANCNGGATFPTTPGVWGPVKPASANCNLGMIKIAFNLAGVGSDVGAAIGGVPNDTAGCVPLDVTFTDQIRNATEYYWDFGDGTAQVGPLPAAQGYTQTHTYTAVGNYLVMLIAINPTSCNLRDTSYIHIRVGDVEALLNASVIKLNPCDAFNYQFNNLTPAIPGFPFTDTSFIWDFGDGSGRVRAGLAPVTHAYAAPGTYNAWLVLNDTTYCNNPDSIQISVRVAANVDALFETPPIGCAPYTAIFNNTSIGGATFEWNFGDPASGADNVSTDINPSHVYITPGTYNVVMVANDPNTCNVTDTARFTIVVYDKPTANFSYTPTSPIENTPNIFTNLSSANATRFKWDFGDGDTLLTTSRTDVTHQYNSTNTFNVCLVAFNEVGCTDTLCMPVSTIVVPALDVPNAFTPNSNDVNNTVMVRGFGIAKMRFIIWNRWGQKVFETGNRLQGWNGRVKGAVQPMDVYAYTLEVEFFDGTKATKKGDITLIR